MFAGSRGAYRPWKNASASRSAKERIIRPLYIRMPFRSPSVHIERVQGGCLSTGSSGTRSPVPVREDPEAVASSPQEGPRNRQIGDVPRVAFLSEGGAEHQVGWGLDRLREMDGARWGSDHDELGAIHRDVMTILTHHAASRQAAMAPYGKMLLAHGAGRALAQCARVKTPGRRQRQDLCAGCAACGESPATPSEVGYKPRSAACCTRRESSTSLRAPPKSRLRSSPAARSRRGVPEILHRRR